MTDILERTPTPRVAPEAQAARETVRVRSETGDESRDGVAHAEARTPAQKPSFSDAVGGWLTAHLLARTVPRWLQGAVMLVMLALVLMIEALFAHAARPWFHPAPILLTGVVFATLVGGLAAGMASAAMAICYELSFALTHGEDLTYAAGTLVMLVVLSPATALAIGTLRGYAERATRDRERLLREQAELLAHELALRDTNRQMDVFLSVVTHELKTPLTSLKGSVQLAIRRQTRRMPPQPVTACDQAVDACDAPDTLALLRRADQQVNRLTRLVDELLDVSRAQTEKLVLRCGPCDLCETVHEAVANVRSAWPSRTIMVSAPAQPVRLTADRDRLEQVITNYLTNALKYSGEDAPVAVRVWADQTSARVAVRDQGPGLSEEAQRCVWERFQQVAGIEARATASGGLGLGLYISRAIIERHSGTVGVDSAPGRGSTFWFALPLSQEAQA